MMLVKEIWKDDIDLTVAVETSLEHLRWRQFKDVARNQTCLQHTCSIVFAGRVLIERLAKYLPSDFDKDLLCTALLVHDLGEGVLKRDVLYPGKTDEKDRDEYIGFCEFYGSKLGGAFPFLFGPKPERAFSFFERAFLLQFCLKNPECFPENARAIMDELKHTKPLEAVCFTAIEHLDYFHYAIEQFRAKGQIGALAEMLALNHIEILDACAREIPGFKQEIWTDKIRGKLAELRNALE